ncbi:uncharacterized protein LOC128820689 [Vidua macroura]|uniref:uncharacterized protein LOC128820689 n=1 Tax=Vidua macroura TaxID=187451 RepID=UPI0023A7B94E|nr:uncharacterized protein LOC128820689 [Vidua macroura]
MALALRLFLPLLLAVALPARAAQAAPLQARGADEHARKASPAAWLHADFQPLKPPADVSAGRTFPGPLVDVAHKPDSHRRGPLRRKNKPTGDSKSLEESKHLEQILSDVERRGDAAGTSTHADKTRKSMRRVFCWGTPCLVKLMAIVAGAALCLMICSAGIWYCWKRKW